MTDAKREMIEGGRSDIANWIAQLKEDPDTILRMDKVILKHDLWRAEDLLALYDPAGNRKLTTNGMARELKKAGFRRPCGTIGCRTMHGQVRLWALRNPHKYAHGSANRLGQEYDMERGRSPDETTVKSQARPLRKKAKF